MKRMGRPFPRDIERERLVKIELLKRYMTISDLARELKMSRTQTTEIIRGTRISPKNEARIAVYFGKRREKLFPPRTTPELLAMREAEQVRRDALHRRRDAA